MQRSLFKLVLLIVALLQLTRRAAGVFTSRVTNGLMFQYTFEEGQTDDTAAKTSDTLNLNFLGDIRLNRAVCSWLPDRPGLLLPGTTTQQVGRSEYSQAALLNSIKATRAWTMETWLQPNDIRQASTIFGIGGWNETAPMPKAECFADPVSFDMYQSGADIGARQAQGTASSRACSSQQDFIESPSLFHLIVTYTANGTAYLYLNGAFNNVYSRVRTWYPYWDAAHRLYLSPNIDEIETKTTWQGSIFLISMYNRILSDTEISTNYAAGLPNAKPQPTSRLIQVIGYQDTSFLYSLALDATDYDGVDGKATWLELVSIPKGTFKLRAQSGWITLTSESPVWRIDTPRADKIDIEFMPLAGQSGEDIQRLGFAGRDEYSLGRIGYVSWTILPVPIPLNQTVRGMVGVYLPIKLQSSNLDPYTSVLAILTSMPDGGGQLFHTATDGKTPIGLAIEQKDLPAQIVNQNGWLAYLAPDSMVAAAGDGVECYGTSKFLFSLQMTDGPKSRSEGEVRVSTCTRLTAIGQNVTIAPDTAIAQMNIRGQSALSTDKLTLVLKSTPSTGTLRHNTSIAMKVGDTIADGKAVYQRSLDYAADLPSIGSYTQTFDFVARSGLIASLPASVQLRVSQLDSVVRWNTRMQGMASDANTMAAFIFDALQESTTENVRTNPPTTVRDQSQRGSTASALTLGSNARWMDFVSGIYCTGELTSAALSSIDTGLLPSAIQTIELWVGLESNAGGIIFAVGSASSSSGYDLYLKQIAGASSFGLCQGSGCNQFVVNKAAFGSKRPATSITSTTNMTAAQTASAEAALALDEYRRPRTHILLTRDSTNVYVWINSVLATAVPMSSSLASRVVLGADGWNGAIFYAATSSSVLTSAQRDALYAFGVPPERPRAIPHEQEVTLDEFVGGTINLVAQGAMNQTGAKQFYIISLPAIGSLAFTASGSNQTQLTSSDLPFLFTPGQVSFSYVAPSGQFSGVHVASFRWTVCSGGRCGRASNVGVVWITITRVVVPPKTIAGAIRTTELTPYRIELQGQDLDAHPPIDSPMDAWWLDTLPTGGKILLSAAATAPDLTRPVLTSQLPVRVPATTYIWFVPTSDSSSGGSLGFRAEVKGAVSTKGALIDITVDKHLTATSGSYVMAYAATRTAIDLVGGMTSGSGADNFLSPVLNSTLIGDNFAVNLATGSTDACVMMLDDAFSFPSTGGIGWGLESSWLTSVSAAGSTVYLQRWVLSSSSASTAASAKLVSSTALLVSGSAGSRRWNLARADWWVVASGTEAAQTRYALCVASGTNPFRSINGTHVAASLTYTNVIGGSLLMPSSGTSNRKALAVDARLLVWPGVGLDDLSVSSSWPTTTRVMTATEILTIPAPTRIWERTVFLLARRPTLGILISRTSASSGAVELCAAPADLPCELPAVGVDFLRTPSQLTSAQRLLPDSFGFVFASTLRLRDAASVLGNNLGVEEELVYASTQRMINITITPPPAPIAFEVARQQQDARPVKPYSDESFSFSLKVIKENTTSSASGVITYRVSMTVLPATAGFSLPVAALVEYSPKVSFASGSATAGNFAATFTAQDLSTLNSILSRITFQPLYVGTYNISASVVAREDDVDSGDVARAQIVFRVASDSSTESDGGSSGTFSFLTGTNMIYVWIGIGVLVLLCVGFKCVRRRRAARRTRDAEKRRADKDARRSDEKDSNAMATDKMIGAVLQLAAATATVNANTLTNSVSSTPIPSTAKRNNTNSLSRSISVSRSHNPLRATAPTPSRRPRQINMGQGTPVHLRTMPHPLSATVPVGRSIGLNQVRIRVDDDLIIPPPPAGPPPPDEGEYQYYDEGLAFTLNPLAVSMMEYENELSMRGEGVPPPPPPEDGYMWT